MSDVTRILSQIESGDPSAAEQLLPLVYDELRKLAAAKLAQEKPGQTLQATALVHEAYLRLVGISEAGSGQASDDQASPGRKSGESEQHWNSRGHFFGAAAEAMRRILVEGARRKGRLKRGGDLARVDIEVQEPATAGPNVDVLAIDDALTQLASEHPAKAELVKLRYFAGLTLAEAAAALGVSLSTADRHWKYSRAWLARHLRSGESPEGD